MIVEIDESSDANATPHNCPVKFRKLAQGWHIHGAHGRVAGVAHDVQGSLAATVFRACFSPLVILLLLEVLDVT
jgi:hypothetical protein